MNIGRCPERSTPSACCTISHARLRNRMSSAGGYEGRLLELSTLPDIGGTLTFIGLYSDVIISRAFDHPLAIRNEQPPLESRLTYCILNIGRGYTRHGCLSSYHVPTAIVHRLS